MQEILNKKSVQILAIVLAVFIFLRLVGQGFTTFQYYLLWALVLFYIAMLFLKKEKPSVIDIKHQPTIQPILNSVINILKLIAITIFLCLLIKIMPAFVKLS